MVISYAVSKLVFCETVVFCLIKTPKRSIHGTKLSIDVTRVQINMPFCIVNTFSFFDFESMSFVLMIYVQLRFLIVFIY